MKTTMRWGAIALVLIIMMPAWSEAHAVGAGQVAYVSGTLTARKADGSVHILSQKSEVDTGDVLSTQKDSYAQINFPDGASMTLRPNTQMKVEAYHFAQSQPKKDSAIFRLIKGGLRMISGLIGHRGNKDAWELKTSVATIGIRGSSGDTLDCTHGCEGVTSTSGTLPPGLYHTTYTGSYIVRNAAGSEIIGEGQFGFVKNERTPPEILPKDPGLNLKELPFALGISGRQLKSGQECIVR
jgi:hypothetical protein